MKNQLRIIELFLISICIVACTSDRNDSTLERNRDLVLTMNREVWNKGNLAAVDELFSANFVQHFLPDSSELNGINTFRERVREHREAFPDWKENIKYIVAEDDLVVIQFESSGTNLGSWLGNPPTGRNVHINEFSILRVENGKIAEQWLMPDLFSLNKQLGLDNR
jgi:steroid delta-isomerase-like uncharacterized protein